MVARRHAVPALFDLGGGDYTAAVVYENARAGVSDRSWSADRYRQGSGRGSEVASSRDRRPDLILDAGWYEIRARYAADSGGTATGTHVIEVKPGRRQAYSIVID